MKFPLVIILLNSIFLSSINAQSQKFEIGIIAGTNFSNLYGNEFVEKFYKSKVGISQGISFQYNINEKFSINSKLLFERKGFWADDGVLAYSSPELGGAGDFRLQNNFDYISIPVAARAYFGQKVKFFINAGPTFSYLIDQTESQTQIRPDWTRGMVFKYLSQFNRLDVGILGGAGVFIPFNNQIGMTIEGGHNLGLINTIKTGTTKNKSSFTLLGINYKL